MKNTVKIIAQKIADDQNLFLMNLIIRGSSKKPSFEIYIDNKNGVTADICADYSREFKDEFEKTEFAEVDYSLIVSSPGIDEPLQFIDQFYKHIGRDFKISFDDGEKVQSIEAKLTNIDNDVLTFIYKKEELIIKFNNLKKAKVKLSF
ncbi:MAG: hypothetical protein KDC52_07340 [Ignavibacteriae bacterium]|nr:hypothetical protein [Ignavibacteriota bacterium]MCB9248960.1 hypothetical protein [Ignavibacteriales bacterium]